MTGAAILSFLLLISGVFEAASPPAHAEPPPPAVSEPSLPPPHLGYGMNVRDRSSVDSLFAPLGLDWLKLWEEYDPEVPTTRYPYRVLFLIDCTQRSDDLAAWGDAVEAIATAGRGTVEAYEICNEPNRRGWLDYDASPAPPDPALYVDMLRVAHARIKAVDPRALVVSAGLAPVGRIEGTYAGWSGNNGDAMDEREYARQMLLLGAGDYFDAFGYHPYGFAYEPERALDELPPSDGGNGFAFRGVEVMRDLMEQHGLEDTPIWATEFSWLRDPSEDGADPGWCHNVPAYRDTFDWMDVSEVQQADYITRAFQYADENWPWMGPMFVWNLDWHDYGWLCEPARYFSVLKIDYAPSEWRLCKDDGAQYGGYVPRYVAPLDAPYTSTLAYDALAAMDKRPAQLEPRLAVEPPALGFLADVRAPGALTGVLVPLNTGFGVFTWTAQVATGFQVTGTGTVGVQVTPSLAITTGFQGSPLTVTVDSTGYSTGTFTAGITVTATSTDVVDAPQLVPVTLRVLPELYRAYLPLTFRSLP